MFTFRIYVTSNFYWSVVVGQRPLHIGIPNNHKIPVCYFVTLTYFIYPEDRLHLVHKRENLLLLVLYPSRVMKQHLATFLLLLPFFISWHRYCVALASQIISVLWILINLAFSIHYVWTPVRIPALPAPQTGLARLNEKPPKWVNKPPISGSKCHKNDFRMPK